MPYNQLDGIVLNKPLGIVGKSSDLRSQVYESFAYRDYTSTAEVLAYLSVSGNPAATADLRKGHFPIFVNDAGVSKTYYFKNGLEDVDLVEMLGGYWSLNESGTGIQYTTDDGETIPLQLSNAGDVVILKSLVTGTGATNVQSNFKIVAGGATGSIGIAAYSGNKAVYLSNDGAILSLDGFDFGGSVYMGVKIAPGGGLLTLGGNGSTITIPSQISTGTHMLGVTATGQVTTNNIPIYFRLYTPTSTADASGTAGEVTADASYVYVKTSGGWKRSALSTF
jgi:hypothetical protein